VTRKLIGTLLAIVLLSPASSFAEYKSIRGVGTASCGQWTAHRKQRDLLTSAFESWLMGYLSAFATWKEGGMEMLDATDNEAFVAWVSNYCEAHPLDSIDSAALSLISEMARR